MANRNYAYEDRFLSRINQGFPLRTRLPAIWLQQKLEKRSRDRYTAILTTPRSRTHHQLIGLAISDLLVLARIGTQDAKSPHLRAINEEMMDLCWSLLWDHSVEQLNTS